MTTTNSDKIILMQLLQRIKFLERSETKGLIIAAEEQLALHFDFQVTYNSYSKNWDYYIRCRLQYPNLPRPSYMRLNRLQTLIANIEFLLEHN